jgi:hypothetical protein
MTEPHDNVPLDTLPAARVSVAMGLLRLLRRVRSERSREWFNFVPRRDDVGTQAFEDLEDARLLVIEYANTNLGVLARARLVSRGTRKGGKPR